MEESVGLKSFIGALLWAVLIIVSIKYVWIVLKYDNDGEGGVLALQALAERAIAGRRR